jgi:exonuclease SbcD
MRILHTSDWHLGKRLFKLDRSSEHEFFLNWLISTLKQKAIDVLLIAGDIFDTPTPPHQSLETFYNFLHRISTETQTQTYIIAGNHDSGLLLEAPNLLLKPHRVKVWGKLNENPADHWTTIEVKNEKLHLCALPFFRSFELLPQGEGDALAALKKYFHNDFTGPRLLMLHHLAGSFKAAGSEQVINLSGLESIPSEVFKSFDYVALGHIHKPQKAAQNAFYSGSPLPMRFSETENKSVMLLECKESKLSWETLPIPQARQMIMLKANEDNFREKISALHKTSQLTPMVELELQLKAPKMGLIDEVKFMLEEKGMELLSYLPVYGETKIDENKNNKIFELSTVQLFEEFYAVKFPQAPAVPEELKQDFLTLLEKVKHETLKT